MRLRLAALTAALALAATACGGTSTTASDPDAAAGQDAPADMADAGQDAGAAAAADDAGSGDEMAAAPTAEAIAALDWQTIDTTEAAIDGRDWAGQDVLLWIWAPWCSVCNREAPEVRPVFESRSDDVVVLGLAGKDTIDAHRGFIAEHDLGFMTHVVDQDNSIWTKYGVGYQPAFVFINQDGQVSVHAGPMDPDDLDAAIDELVAA